MPFKVEQGEGVMSLLLSGVVSWTDLIVQGGEGPVEEVRWAQRDSTTLELLAYTNTERLKGYRVYRDERGDLVWQLEHWREEALSSLDGLRIYLDAGHGGNNYGAIGPTGLSEKRANLLLARAVQAELERAGAEVLMSRSEDVAVALGERVAQVQETPLDLSLSLHHNALPQGTNPAGYHGASVHYYNRHALPLARALHRAIIGEDWGDNGLRYQDLALARITTVPAVLIEFGFMMHPEEEWAIAQPAYREEMARRVRRGLEGYFEQLREGAAK